MRVCEERGAAQKERNAKKDGGPKRGREVGRIQQWRKILDLI